MLSEVRSKKKVFCKSLEDLDNAAKEILNFARGCQVWKLQGEMGSGKTTLVKSLAKVLGVIDIVTSPTFSLVNEYQTANGETIYHFDFYRIKSLEEALSMGIEDYLDSESLCLIEWPSVIEQIIPDSALLVEIDSEPTNSRIFHLTKND